MPRSWAWLRAHAGAPRFGFLRRDGTGALGVGVAEQIEGDSMAQVLDEAQARGGVWFVGGAFDPRRPRAPWWAPFGAARAWRPRWRHDLVDPGIPAPVQGAPAQAAAPLQAPAPGRFPDRDTWERLVQLATDGFEAERFDKVVLARSIVEPTATDALTWLDGSLSPREMAFCFEPSPAVSFAGRTPELLFERRGRAVHSEALAGTDVDTPDGRARLMASDKDAREHALVVDAVDAALAPLCEQLGRSDLQLTATGRLVHRLVSFEGRLAAGAGDAELVRRLHPTPAVAGTPCDAALSFLREHEPFDRGWYAGMVGLVEPGRTTLAVALRCALWLGDTRITYAGAGLVPGSRAQAEWDETELKSHAVRRR